MAKAVWHTTHGIGLTPAAGVTTYVPFGDNLLGNHGLEANRTINVRRAGELTDWRVLVSANAGTTNSTVTLRKSSVDGASISVTASTTGEFSTATATSIAEGDALVAKIVPAAVGTVTYQAMSCVYNAYGAPYLLAPACGSVTLAVGNTTRYIGLGGRSLTTLITTESFNKNVIKASGTMRDLFVYVLSNARANATTIRNRISTPGRGDAAANGSLVVSIGASATGVFEDTTNSDFINNDEAVDISMTTGSGTPTIAFEHMGASIGHARTYQMLLANNSAGYTASTASVTRYSKISGDLQVTATEAENVLSPLAADCTARDGWFYVSANARTSATTHTLRQNGADTAMTLSVGAAATGQFEDVTDQVALASDDAVCWEVVFGAGANNITYRSSGLALEYPMSLLPQTARMRPALMRS